MFIGSTSGLAISFTIQDLWSVGLPDNHFLLFVSLIVPLRERVAARSWVQVKTRHNTWRTIDSKSFFNF
jgi:hypothetical protein